LPPHPANRNLTGDDAAADQSARNVWFEDDPQPRAPRLREPFQSRFTTRPAMEPVLVPITAEGGISIGRFRCLDIRHFI
jgi:hypothetical protein